MSTLRTATQVTRRSSPVAAAVFGVAVTLLATGCGSQLTEAQVLSRSGAQTGTSGNLGQQAGTSGSLGQQPGAGQPSSSAVTGGSAPGSTQGKPGAGTTANTSNSTTGKAAAPGTAMAGGSAGAGAGCTAKGSGPIKIASVGNYSGPGGASQARFPQAVQVWAAAQNAKGGLCGRPVQVLVADDGGDPSSYAAKIKDMVENQHVVAFVSNGAALSASGGEAYHKKSGVPVIGTECGFRFYYTEAIYAPTCSYLDQTLVDTARAGVKLSGKKKLGLLYCREAEACAIVNEVISNGGDRKAGAQLVYKAAISVTQIDFTAECQNAKAAGVDLMWIGADAATLSRVAQSCARQGFRPQFVASGLSISGETTKVDGLKNIIVGSFVFPFTGATSPAIAEYDKDRQQYAPNVTPDPGYAIAWTGAKLFELLATRAAKTTGDISPAALRAALLTVKGETLGGLTPPLSYSSSGSEKIKDCYFPMQGNGKGGYQAPFGAAAQCV